MLVRIARETKPHHASADADRLALLDEPAPTREQYLAFLESVYAFEVPYELALVQTPGLDPRILRHRSKSARLHNDLLALGASDADLGELPRPAIPMFRSEAQALGWLYVVERNTLLHGLMRRHLGRAIPTVIERAGAYLAAYESPGTRYRELGVDLDAAARRAMPGEIIGAAHAAFACQRFWFAHAGKSVRRALAS